MTSAKPFSPNTPTHGVQGVGNAAAAAAQRPVPATPPPPPPAAPQVARSPRPVTSSAPAPGARPAAGGAPVACPQCGHTNSPTNRFCASCGYNLSAIPLAPSAAPPAVAPAPQAARGAGVMLTALRADGSEAGSYQLPDSPTVTVGRDTGSIFAGDSYLSPRHASFTRRNAQLFVRDDGSLNGVYIKLRPNEPCLLEFGDVFRIGQEIIRLEELKGMGKSPDGVERFGSPAKGYIGRLALVIGRDTTGNAFPIPERGVHCGRERGDILFSEDGYVSGLHCRVGKAQDGRIYLTDVGSSNGTFVRLRIERALAPGDILLMGQQLFRVDF